MASPPVNLAPLRRAFVDICKGYSVTSYQDKPLYIRHLGHFHHLSYDDLQARFEKDAVAKGAKTEAQRLIDLRARGQWSDQKEKDIEVQKDAIIRFEEGKKTVSQPSVLRSYDQQIADERAKLTKLVTEKHELLGMTAEAYAQRMLNDYYIVTNLFSDRDLTQLVFTTDSFDTFPDSVVEEILDIYNKAIDNCSDYNLRRLAVQDFFTSYYGLAGDDIKAFFGRSICDMTYYQIRLANIARYFKSIMEQSDLGRMDPAVRYDPEAIERMYTAQKNASAMASEGKVPANLSQQDIKELNLQGQFTKIEGELSGIELVKHLRKQQQVTRS